MHGAKNIKYFLLLPYFKFLLQMRSMFSKISTQKLKLS